VTRQLLQSFFNQLNDLRYQFFLPVQGGQPVIGGCENIFVFARGGEALFFLKENKKRF